MQDQHVINMSSTCHQHVINVAVLATIEGWLVRNQMQATLVARPNQSCMFPYRYIDFRFSFYLSFSTIFKILFRRFYSPESDPPHKIMRYLVYYSTQLGSWFPPDRNLSGGNALYWRCTRFEKAFRRGRPLNILHDSWGRAVCRFIVFCEYECKDMHS